jgi:hypothetical protein
MTRKAQAEIVVIVGVLILGIVVVYYAVSGGFPSSNIPKNLYDEQKAFHDSFVNLIRKGADNALMVMEAHGGYLTTDILPNETYTPVPSVLFMDEGVPYWTKCQNNLAPSKREVEHLFELAMEKYIKDHIRGVAGSYKNVTLDMSKLSVSVNILSDPHKVEITIKLPTTVNGYNMVSQFYPYKISLDSKLGEIYDFASDLSEAQSSKRFLEIFTMASIYMSADAPDDYPKLPTGGFLTDCGETIYRTPDQISIYLREIAQYVITQTLWWQKMPVDTSKPKIYAIDPDVMTTQYRDLDIQMYLPDDFSLTTQGSVVIRNTVRAFKSGIWTASDCLGVYNMAYAVNYPVIVRVNDPLSGYSFNFAFHVFVDNAGNKMLPGNCENIKTIKDLCVDVDCYAKLKVTDDVGRPLQGAVATFGDCGIGYTDADGNVEGGIKCGTSELNIYMNSSYDYYNQNVSSSSINGTYVLRQITNITAYFNKVSIVKQGEVTKCFIGKATDYIFLDMESENVPYFLTNIDTESIPENCTNQACLAECNRTQNLDLCLSCAASCTGSVVDSTNTDFMPAGMYDTNATMMSMFNMKETGGFITPYTLKSSTKSIYIHVPEASPDSFSYMISQSKKLSLAQELRVCQIEPISENSYPKTTIVATCTCENLRAIWEDVKSTCTNPNIVNLFCTCPSGTAWSDGCGKECGDEYSPACITCCNADQIKFLVQDWAKNCNTRVICK